ncbi:homoserine dehydrogenase [soil metagenome]
MADPLGIALVGCGTVGGGVAELLLGQASRFTRRTGGVPLELKHVVIRDLNRTRPHGLPINVVTTNWAKAIADPAVGLVIELIGGTTTAKEVVLTALKAGKHVVTANKALLAAHGRELFDAARAANRSIGFEAAVAGGIPIIKALAESLSANQVTAIQGILNGTSNFILSSMADLGMTYEAALKEAQHRGYAEADPTLDVDGSDAAHKLAVLAQIAFGVTPQPNEIEKRGIAGLDALDIRFAAELGYTIKLLAEAWTLPGAKVSLHVSPVLLRSTDMMAQVRGAFNAIRVVGDVVGETLYQGAGAGKMPTASSVMSDVIDVAVGRLPLTFKAAGLWSGQSHGFTVGDTERVPSRFYLRVLVKDRPGVLAEVCRLLAVEKISIASVVQHEAIDGHPEQTVPLVIMTHAAEAGRFKNAVAAIGRFESVSGKAVYFPVAD